MFLRIDEPFLRVNILGPATEPSNNACLWCSYFSLRCRVFFEWWIIFRAFKKLLASKSIRNQLIKLNIYTKCSHTHVAFCYQISGLTSLDRWMLSRCSHLVSICEESFPTADLDVITHALSNFFRHDLSKIYLVSMSSTFTCTIHGVPGSKSVQQS